MANYNADPYSGMTASPQTLASAEAGYGGSVVQFAGTLTYASQASGSTITLFRARAGMTFLAGFFYTDTSTGSATVAIGGGPSNPASSTTGNIANKYRVAGAVTTTDVPQWFYSYVSASTEWLTDPITQYSADEYFYITTAAAALPSSGIMYVCAFFATS